MEIWRWAALWVLCVGCGQGSAAVHDDASLREFLQDVVERHDIASVSAGAMVDGQLVHSAAAGVADARTGRAATTDTLYAVASCSKPVVGVAIARLMQRDPSLDLDTDIDEYLDWEEPFTHPAHPDVPITLRHLVTHTSGLAGDGPDDYDTYPKPDPDEALDAWLEGLLADDAYWLSSAPGASEAYSNLGAALAGLVVEKVSGQDFASFCNDEIFGALGMTDTRWRFGELSAEQQARTARPHGPDLEPYEHYGFNDYPSGQLRTTVPDFARLLGMLANDGVAPNGQVLLTATSVDRFESVPLFIEGGDDPDDVAAFDHSGGETGVTAYFTYREDGRGYLYFVNSDLDDDDLEILEEELSDTLATLAGIPTDH